MEQKIKNAIRTLLESGIGFEVNLFMMLSIDTLEDGRYRIFETCIEDNNELEDNEEIYDNVEVAIDRYFQIRKNRNIGHDLEEKWLSENDD